MHFLGINYFDNKLCKEYIWYTNYILINYKNSNFFNWIKRILHTHRETYWLDREKTIL